VLFGRIREASEDGLTGRIALALAGGSVAFLCTWFAADGIGPAPFQLIFAAFAVFGIYLIGRAIFSRAPRVAPILLSYFFAPIGVICIAIAMPLAAIVRFVKGATKT
jgi:hypothetical protein